MIRLSVNFPFRKKCRSDAARRVRRGHDRHDWSRGCPNAPWTAYADKFPCPRRKLSTGGVDALWTKLPRSGRKPLRGAFIRSTGANAAYWGCRWSARTGFAFGTKPSREALVRLFAGSGRASVMAVVFTCNTYSVPYKGKDLKKRLSPKSLNTLIHQCITFYVFLIFQYLSLWKSVFGPD